MRVLVHVTGFGKFQGVEDNPTTHLIKELPDYMKENPLVVTESFIMNLICLIRLKMLKSYHTLCLRHLLLDLCSH